MGNCLEHLSICCSEDKITKVCNTCNEVAENIDGFFKKVKDVFICKKCSNDSISAEASPDCK